MANPLIDALSQARALLQAGKVQDADDLIQSAITDAAKAANEPLAPAPPPPPRAPEAIVLDLFKGVHSLLGNNPSLQPLITELEAVLKPHTSA